MLFRQAQGAREACVTNAERATSQVIVDAIGEIGLDRLAGACRAYVNVSRELLLTVRPFPLPPDRVVLEILEDQEVDDELVDVVCELTRAGFVIALDYFVYDPALLPLIDLARIVKLDILALGPAGLKEHVARLRGRGLRAATGLAHTA